MTAIAQLDRENHPTAPSGADYDKLRRTMVERQVRTYDVSNLDVVARFFEVPRHLFVPEAFRALAYTDCDVYWPLANGGRRYMLAPLVAARLLQNAQIAPHETVLTVGGGAGYLAALAAPLARRTVALESEASLCEVAARQFAALGLPAQALCEDFLNDGPAAELFDVILVEGAIAAGWEKLEMRLAPGGRIIAFVPQAAGHARAVLSSKRAAVTTQRELFEAAARPLEEFSLKPHFAF